MLEQAPLRDLPKGVIMPLSWAGWINKVWMIVGSVNDSGTTAQRPTKNLWVGRYYFDTSLGAHGKPIWCSNVTSGTWIDSASNIV